VAQTTNLYDSYDSKGNREDLSDIIYNISPTETPLFQLAGRTRATNPMHEWQTDALASASTSNALIEGDEYALAEPTATTRVNNRTQILTKVYGTSESQRWIEKAGRADELAYIRAKAAKELKRDVEATLLNNQASVAGNATTARKLGGLPAWLASNTSFGSGGSDNGFSSGTGLVVARTNGTERSFTGTLLNAVFQDAWTNGGNPSVMLIGGKQKTVFVGFDGIATPRHEVSDKTIYDTAEVYIGPFGSLKVMLDRHIRQTTSIDRDVFLIDPDYLKIAIGDDFHTEELAKVGHSDREAMVVELTLEVCNEAAHGLVTDLN